MPSMPTGYYNRFTSSDNYDEHLFRAGKVLQSAELNEIQSQLGYRIRSIGDTLFKDGAVIKNAQIVVDAESGTTILESGAVYLRGAVRGVAPKTITIPTTGTVSVGIYLVDTVVTELEDAALRDPAVGVRNYQEPGAARLMVETEWGYAGDGGQGDFYPVYTVIDGDVQSKEPPPQIDAISLAISRYDRQSSGGFYAVDGLSVLRLADDAGAQVYSVTEGTARVNGREVILSHARRVEYAAVPDTKLVNLEQHLASGGTERVDLNHSPVVSIQQISITKEKTVTVTHGAYTGIMDSLPDSPVVQLVEVKQGGTTYSSGVDYKLTSDKVDWSLAGAEPAPGSSYTVKYRYIATVSATSPDDTGFTVSDAVAGTLIQVTYEWAMPRIDRLCLNELGQTIWVKGTSAIALPKSPKIPKQLLGIATVYQNWNTTTRVVHDAVRVVPMNELVSMNSRIDTLFALMAEERLVLNASLSDPTAKKGVFSDAFYDDDLRDQGLEQTGAILNQELTLAFDVDVQHQQLSGLQSLDAKVITETEVTSGVAEVVISQPLRTSQMKINPYLSFAPLPGVARLSPAIDYWTEFQTTWLSPITRRIDDGSIRWTNPSEADRWIGAWDRNEVLPWVGDKGIQAYYDRATWIRMHSYDITTESVTQVENKLVGTKYVDLQFLRQISVRFDLSGFGPGETLTQVIFDGRSVAFSAP